MRVHVKRVGQEGAMKNVSRHKGRLSFGSLIPRLLSHVKERTFVQTNNRGDKEE